MPVTWKGNPTELIGKELVVGDPAPSNFTVVTNDMAKKPGAELAGKKRIVLSVPSLDTGVCDMETRRFNKEAASIPGVEVFTVSMDLPFAQKRWCGAAGIDRLTTLSDYRERSFGPAYGVLEKGRMLLVRAVFVIGADDKIRHVEYVKEVTTEPDYAAALEAAKKL
jgi:thiol peroxidase